MGVSTRERATRIGIGIIAFILGFVTSFFLLLGYGGCFALRTSQRLTEQSARIREVQLELDDWSLVALDGEAVPFSGFRKKVVFLSFWSTWCAPCVEEIPSIERLFDEFTGDGRVAFLLVTREDADTVREFWSERGFRLPVYLVREGVPSTLGVHEDGGIPLPTTVILDCDGRIVLHEVGRRDWGSAKRIEMLSQYVEACPS